MTTLATLDPYGALIEPLTLRIQRLLPGPIERVWAYLKYQTKSFLTQSWYNTSSTSNRFSWRIPHDLMR